jgi:uncharacterized membrane protein YfcA
MDIWLNGLLYAFIGVFAGLMAGVLGVGGGIIVVPALVIIFQINHVVPESLLMHVAAGTSLTIMIFTSLAAIRAHHQAEQILWSVYRKLWSGIVAGAALGGIFAQLISTYWLKVIFGLFLLLVAIKMYADIHVTRARRTPPNWVDRLVSFLMGLKSGLLGVGGGVLIVPYLDYCGIEPRKIAAVSNLCTLTVALVGSVVFVITGYREMASVPYTTGYIYWPAVFWVALLSSMIAPWGTRLNYILPVKQLKLFFIIILLLTVLKMLF